MPTIIDNSTESKLRHDLKTICDLAYSKGLINGFDGNFSLRMSEDRILITPANCHRGLLREEDFIVVNLDGKVLSNNGKEPTFDLYIHLAVYKKRPDVHAFIHGHPITAVSLTTSNININEPLLPNSLVEIGDVGLSVYKGFDGEKDLEQIINLVEKHDVILLERHGSVTLGKDIFNAFQKLETLESSAKVLFNSHKLGEVNILSHAEIEELENKENIKLSYKSNHKFTIKNLIKKLVESDRPVFQRVLNLTHEITLNTIENTSYSSKLTKEEKEQLARELTTSFFSMILGKFTPKS